MGSYKPLINDLKRTGISETEKESFVNVASPLLASGICKANTFNMALLDLSELQFVPSLGLLDI